MSLKYKYKAHLQGSGSVFTMVIPMFLYRLLEIRERKGVRYVLRQQESDYGGESWDFKRRVYDW